MIPSAEKDLTKILGDYAEDFVADHHADAAPFFLYLAYNAPHFGKGYSPADKKPVNLMQPQAAELKRVKKEPARVTEERNTLKKATVAPTGN
jgi:hypothetical protein